MKKREKGTRLSVKEKQAVFRAYQRILDRHKRTNCEIPSLFKIGKIISLSPHVIKKILNLHGVEHPRKEREDESCIEIEV